MLQSNIKTLERKADIIIDNLSNYNININEKEFLINKSKQMFGITKDFTKAGFILEDGSMLNFKKHTFDRLEHSEIEKLGIEINDFLRKTNSIRLYIGKTKIKEFFENEENLIPENYKNKKFITEINIESKNTLNQNQYNTISFIYNNTINPYIIFDIGNKYGEANNIKELKNKLLY